MKHVVALSGGKDSTALALRLREVLPGVDFDYVCTPTGDELPELFEHLQRMEALLGKPLIRLTRYQNGNGLHQLIREQSMIPNHRARFCTRMLKIEPTLEWLAATAPVRHYVGLRADEPFREGIYGDIEGVEHVYPMREWGWSVSDVWQYLESVGVSVPRRTDCALCFWQKLAEWKRLHRQHPEAYQGGVELEQELGHTFRSNGRDTWPADLDGLRAEFETGRPVRGYSEQRQLRMFDCSMDDSCRVCSM